ncbi:MAG: PASTA domain-containing protein, partial [Actinomycetes bacterium]
ALDYSHRHGIVHRDIKPANVMLTRTGDVKVMDFGIARALADSSATMTSAHAVMGTAQYLSPEQARGEVVDARSDLYSTGCLLYELLTGRPPFTGDSPVSVAYQHVSENPLPPSRIDPAVPTSLDALVLKSLAKNPNDRYQTAADFRSDVERAIAGMPVTSAVPPVAPVVPVAAAAGGMVGGFAAADATQRFAAATAPTPPVDPGGSRRSPWMWIGIALIILLVAAVAAFATVTLTNSNKAVEQVTVPILTGKTVAVAQQALITQGLTLGTQTLQNSETTKGQILSQDPAAGSQLAKGQPVNVVVSAGKTQVQVPNLIGMPSSDDARVALSDAQLQLGSVTEKDSDQPKGQVLSQSPTAGNTVDSGSKVSITVSSGLVAVPNVVNQTQAQASATLSNAGFQVVVVQQISNTATAGTVLAQAPTANSKAQKGSTVTITVAQAPASTSAAARANEPPAAINPAAASTPNPKPAVTP